MKAEFRLIAVLALVVVSVGVSACSRRDAAATNADPLAHGKQVVQRMSDALAAAPAFTVTTHEVRDAVHSDGSIKHLTLDHQVTVRRPDRLYVKTTGDRQTEAWYDGAGITVLSHADKVFGQAPMPETIDRTIDALHERYGFYVPGSDMYHSSPAHALLTDTTTGGWVGLETISGQSCDHVAFEDRGVKWEIWVPANGTALPLRTKAEFPNVKRIRNFEISFSDWNLSPAIAADRFTPKVPADYEGIAMIQRAAVMANIPDQPATASDPKK
jgi:hypothetical protein